MAFLIDDILLAPIKGLAFVARKLQDTAMEEFLDEDNVRQQLRELYMLLETEKISKEEFDKQEEDLVERLEEIQTLKAERREAS